MGLVVSLYCLFIDLLFMLYLLIGDFGVGCGFVVWLYWWVLVVFVVCLLVCGLAVAFLCCMFDWFGVGVVCGFWVCCLFCLIVILIVYRVFGGWLVVAFRWFVCLVLGGCGLVGLHLLLCCSW